MRSFLTLALFICTLSAFGQKSISKPGRITTPLPMTLWQYYSYDSVSYVYNALNVMSAYSYCQTPEGGPVPTFNSLQNSIIQASKHLSTGEGSAGYLFFEEPFSTSDYNNMKDLGLTILPDLFKQYSAFVVANKEALQNGDEAMNTKMYYYDSLLYETMASSPDMSTLYKLTKDQGLFVRQDGTAFEPNFTGKASVKTAKNTRLEELDLVNGLPSGGSYIASSTGVPVSEIIVTKNFTTNTYYDGKGRVYSKDTTFTSSNTTQTYAYFPSGKINSAYSNLYTGTGDDVQYLGSVERQFYANGKPACVIETNLDGATTIVSAFDPKGKVSVKKGTGKVYRENIDAITGATHLVVAEYRNNIQAGLNQTFINGTLTSEYSIVDGIMGGSQKQFHWKNGKLISETTYDAAGNYISENNTFDANAPKIDPSKLKINITTESDPSCMQYGIADSKLVVATLKNEKALIQALQKKYNLLHYNADNLLPSEMVTYKYLTVDVTETGKVINVYEYTDKEAEILALFSFTPATYAGKPIKSRIAVNIEAYW
jgi:hypothetical protein